MHTTVASTEWLLHTTVAFTEWFLQTTVAFTEWLFHTTVAMTEWLLHELTITVVQVHFPAVKDSFFQPVIDLVGGVDLNYQFMDTG